MAIAINTKKDHENGTASPEAFSYPNLPEALKERLDKIMLPIADQYPGVDRYRLEDIYFSLLNADPDKDWRSAGRIARQKLIERILSEEYDNASSHINGR